MEENREHDMTPATHADTEDVQSLVQKTKHSSTSSYGKGVGSELSRKFKERRIR